MRILPVPCGGSRAGFGGAGGGGDLSGGGARAGFGGAGGALNGICSRGGDLNAVAWDPAPGSNFIRSSSSAMASTGDLHGISLGSGARAHGGDSYGAGGGDLHGPAFTMGT